MSLKRPREYTPTIDPSFKKELAVSPKKLKELEFCLQSFSRTRVGSLLIITGPSGSGKTTSFKVLCSELNLTISEYSNKDTNKKKENNKVEEVLEYLKLQCGSKKRLNFNCSITRPSINIILIDSLPTYIFNEHKNEWQGFLSNIKIHDKLICIILSDTSKKTIEMKFSGIDYTLVQFIKPARTYMIKAIERVNSILETSFSPENIFQLSNSNLNKMVNLMLANKDGCSVTQNGADDFEFQFFHTLGKFLYNKRVDPTGAIRYFSEDELKLKKTRPKTYFSPEDIINRCQCEIQFFWLYILENSFDFYEKISDLDEFLAYCQVADRLDSYMNHGFLAKDLGIPSYIVSRAVMDCNTKVSQHKGLFMMKVPLVNNLGKELNHFFNDMGLEAGQLGVSRSCYIEQYRWGEIGKICSDSAFDAEEAEDDYLWKEVEEGIDNIKLWVE